MQRPSNDEAGVGRLPSEVTERVPWFDRLASRASAIMSSSWIVAALPLAMVATLAWGWWAGETMRWHARVATATTVLTLSLVVLLENAQRRNHQAVQHKLNALAHALSHLVEGPAREELRLAIGLEHRESTTGNIRDGARVFAPHGLPAGEDGGEHDAHDAPGTEATGRRPARRGPGRGAS